jgi:hypothetical protein
MNILGMMYKIAYMIVDNKFNNGENLRFLNVSTFYFYNKISTVFNCSINDVGWQIILKKEYVIKNVYMIGKAAVRAEHYIIFAIGTENSIFDVKFVIILHHQLKCMKFSGENDCC